MKFLLSHLDINPNDNCTASQVIIKMSPTSWQLEESIIKDPSSINERKFSAMNYGWNFKWRLFAHFSFFLLLIYPRCEKRNLLNFLFSGEWINEDEASEEMEMKSAMMMRLLMTDKLKMISIEEDNWELFMWSKANFFENFNNFNNFK